VTPRLSRSLAVSGRVTTRSVRTSA
jgi:hypothetical protein